MTRIDVMVGYGLHTKMGNRPSNLLEIEKLTGFIGINKFPPNTVTITFSLFALAGRMGKVKALQLQQHPHIRINTRFWRSG